MGSKFRIIIASLVLIICFSLVDDVEPSYIKYAAKLGSSLKHLGKLSLGPLKKVRSKVNVVNDVTSLVTGMDGVINLIKNDKSNELFQDKVERQLEEIMMTCEKITAGQFEIENFTSIVTSNADFITTEIKNIHSEGDVQEFEKQLALINDNYKKKFAEVWKNLRNYTSTSIDDYLVKIVDNNNFRDNLDEIVTHSKGSNRIHTVFRKYIALFDTKKKYKLRCGNIASLDDIYDFYERIISTVARAYTMLIMSYQKLKMNASDRRYRQDFEEAESRHLKEAIIEITRTAEFYFNNINDTDYFTTFSCDPKKWKEENNFIRIKNYVSTQATNYWKYFNVTPESYNETIEYDCDFGLARYPNRFIDAPETISAPCTSPFSPWVNLTNVAYEEYKHYHNRILTRKCQQAATSQFFYMCENDRNSDPVLSIRKLSLILQSCRTDINEVVTNARFYEKDGIISIQVQCGVLMDGEVDPVTLRWNVDDRRFTRESHPNFVVLNATLKSFNLDDIVLPNGELLTGVKFEVVDNNFISLVIQGSKIHNYYNRTTIRKSKLYLPNKTGTTREIINLNQTLKRPSAITNQTYEVSKPGQNYINLTISEFSDKYHNDVLFPYLDTSPLIALPLAPLGGLGLFYKSVPGYAGFLALKYLVPKYINFVDIEQLEQSMVTQSQDPVLTMSYLL